MGSHNSKLEKSQAKNNQITSPSKQKKEIFTSPNKKKTAVNATHLTENFKPSPPASPQANFISENAKASPMVAASSPMKTNSPFRSPERFIVSTEVLGEGAFSFVTLATSSKTGQKVAAKTLKKKKPSSLDEEEMQQYLEDEKMFLREKEILKGINHPNVIKLLAFKDDEESHTLYLDYVEGGDLYAWVCNNGRIQERVSRQIFKQMVDAVEYCHSVGICHRDLKLENFLLDVKQMRVVLIDFGFATKLTTDGIFNDFPGSPAYACPSILKGRPYDGRSADIYALGVVLYTMHFSSYPFYHDDLITMCHMICDDKLILPSAVPTSFSLSELIRMMMEKESKKRATMEQVRSHPWLSTNVPASPGTKKILSSMFRNSPISKKSIRN